MAKQLSFQNTNWRNRYSHGGALRQKRAGRGARPLSSKEPIHLVFKANKEIIRGGFRLHRRFTLIHYLLQKYQAKFFIKIEQVSIQGDHIHLLIRTSRRSLYQNFFRVVAGQIAQRFEKEGLLTFANSMTEILVSAKTNSEVGSATKVTGTPAMRRDWVKRIGVTDDTPTGFGSKPCLWRKEPTAGLDEAGSVDVASAVDVVVGAAAGFEVTGGEESRMLPQAKLKALWKHRPFTRVVKGYRAYQTVRDYIQLNEREALGELPDRSQRLKTLSSSEWEILWS